MDVYDKLRLALYICEVAAAVTGFIYWKKIRDTYWKWFPVYLLIIAIIETVTESSFQLSNDYEFNAGIHEYFGIPLQFLFFFWLFYKNSANRWPLIGAVIYVAVWIADMLYFRDRQLWFLSFSYTIGNIILLILLVMYFIKLVTSDAIMVYRSVMMFWICLGLLLFYIGTLPLYGMYNTLAGKYPTLFNNYWIIAMCLDCIMYLLFASSFIWGKLKS